MRFREIYDYITHTPGNTNPVILKQMLLDYVATANNSLAAYTVDANIADSVDLLGKKASDLQKGVFVDDYKVFGTIKHVTGYTGFSGDPAEQEGYYLVLHFALEGADSIKVNDVTLDSDGLHIIRFMNPVEKTDRKLKVEIVDGQDSIVDYLDISGLKFE